VIEVAYSAPGDYRQMPLFDALHMLHEAATVAFDFIDNRPPVDEFVNVAKWVGKSCYAKHPTVGTIITKPYKGERLVFCVACERWHWEYWNGFAGIRESLIQQFRDIAIDTYGNHLVLLNRMPAWSKYEQE
jgi:hypothetical protein